ncbi:MAG: hypothetical protein ACRCWQ_13785 [Bacilli bacterium]
MTNSELLTQYTRWCEETTPIIYAVIDALYAAPTYGQTLRDETVDALYDERNEATDALYDALQQLREMI